MTKFIFQRLLVPLVLVLCWQFAAAQAPLSVRFAPEKDYGPFIYQDEHGQIRGLSWDILQAVAQSSNLTITTLTPAPLATILAQAQSGQVDLISSLRPTPERAQFLNFTQPYVAVPAVLVVRDDAAALSLKDLAAHKVAVGKGFAVESFVRAKYPAVDWVAVSDDRQALILLQQGKVAAVVADIASVIFIGKSEKQHQWRIAHNVGFQYQLSFAYPKAQLELGRRLDEALFRLPVEQREQLLARWLDAAQITEEQPFQHLVSWVGGVLIGLAVLYLAWLLYRRKGRGD
ncbi:transporter substrate-binding domain-containing protein [Chitinibacter sp. SCUT-21]|uniref:transporter substrate-binding domain-containing protein n=1 Tax=Chitinibacter sp. SCUT-21 TaxID=2970891 RepID=UPI0035A5B370